MARGNIYEDVTDTNGNALVGVQVTVYETGTLNLATLYDAVTGGNLVNNPLTTDSQGVVQAYTETGEYDLSVAAPTGTFVKPAVTVLDSDDVQAAQDSATAAAASAASAAASATAASLLQPYDSKTELAAATGYSVGDYASFYRTDVLTQVKAVTDTGQANEYEFIQGQGVVWQVLIGENGANVKSFGAVGDGVADDEPPIAAAMAQSLLIYFPQATYLCGAELNPQAGSVLVGDGMDNTTIKASNSTSATVSLLSFINTGNITVKDLTVDGNKAGRSGTASGSNFRVWSSKNKFINVRSINAPNAGFILDGQTHAASLNEFRGCVISTNGGVGLSQHTAKNSSITQSFFTANGKENLTIDNTSHSCIVDGNRFFRHLGGCGNIGWDDADNSIFSNNFIDNESDTTATAGNRNGICINGQAGITTMSNISNNVIVGCSDSGIILRDRSGTGGFAVGSAIIEGNSIANCGESLTIEDGAGNVIVKGNQMPDGITVSDSDGDDVRFGAGEIAFNYQLTSNQTITAPASAAETTVDFDNANLERLVTNDGSGVVSIPVGGIYTLTAKVRIQSLGAGTNIDTISLGIELPSGVTRWFNFDNDVGNTDEITFTTTELIDKGDIKAKVRFFGSSTTSENPVIMATDGSYFSGVLVG